jgi:dsRNA-specific ribonuclease
MPFRLFTMAESGQPNTRILADALEAVIAASYLDGGLPAARQVLLSLLGPAANAPY